MNLPSRLLALVGLALATGCNRNSGNNPGYIAVENDDGETISAELTLTLDAETAQAGEAVGYVVDLSVSDGTGESLEVLLTSDVEEVLPHTGAGVAPTIAGLHTLSASTVWRGETLEATASLGVEPAALHTLDLQLSDIAFPAGGSVDWAVAGWDRYGNTVDASAAEVTTDSSGLSVGGSDLTGTAPGTYAATAQLDDASDTELVVILPATPSNVELTLSDTDLERYETTVATVVVTDDYGNTVDADWTLSVDGTGSTAIAGSAVSFFDEGQYTVRVDVDGTSLFDEVGPLLIDSSGPVIEIDTPQRGDWTEAESGTVTGTLTEDWSGIASLTINGAAATVETDGSFNENVPYDWGVNVIETTAIDGDGNESVDVRAVLSGDFLPDGDAVDDGMSVRINEGTGGLGTLESLGEDLISAQDLTSLIPNPVFSDSSQSCVTIPFVGTQCVTWYSVNLRVSNPAFGDADLDLDPRNTGQLWATVTVDDISLRWNANGKVAGVNWSASGDITADDISVQLKTTPSVNNGNIRVQINQTNASTTNFDFDMNGALYDVLSFFGVNNSINSLISGYLEDAIEDVVEDEVPDLVDDLLSDLEISESLDILGNTYTLAAEPYDIDVDNRGLNLDLATSFTPQTTSSPWAAGALGSLFYDYGGPSWSQTPGTIVGVNGDFLNQVFTAVWAGGVLDQEVDSSSLGLDASDLSFLFPGLTTLTVQTEALLPPVVLPGTGAEMFDLQLGDLLITLYDGTAGSGSVLIQVYVSAFVGLDVDSDGASLSASVGTNPDLYFDVVVPEADGLAASETEVLLETLVPLILPFVTDALGEIPIPDIQGFTITGVSVDVAGPEDGWLTLGGNLVEN